MSEIFLRSQATTDFAIAMSLEVQTATRTFRQNCFDCLLQLGNNNHRGSPFPRTKQTLRYSCEAFETHF